MAFSSFVDDPDLATVGPYQSSAEMNNETLYVSVIVC